MEHFIALSIILTFEFMGDFVFQSREVAKNKSSNFNSLEKHLTILSLFVFVGTLIGFICSGSSFFVSLIVSIFFSLTNGLIHGIIDWNLWKGYKLIVKRRFKGNLEEINNFVEEKEFADDPMFYNFIGFDRLLHVLTILGLYFLIRS